MVQEAPEEGALAQPECECVCVRERERESVCVCVHIRALGLSITDTDLIPVSLVGIFSMNVRFPPLLMSLRIKYCDLS